MDRNSLSSLTRSRISESLFSPASASHLGKRGATEAGIDDTYTLQKTNRELSARIGTLEKRNQTLGRLEQDLSREIQDLKADNEVLRQNRASLVDRTKADGSLSEDREKQWKEEKAELVREITALKNRETRTRNENERLETECMHLNTKINNLEQVAKPIAGLNARIVQLQEQNQELHGWRARAESFSIALEEEKRRQKTSAQDQHDREEDRGGEQVYKKEMERQTQYLSTLSQKLNKVELENTKLLASKKELEQAATEYKTKETDFRTQIRILNDQLERSRHDMDSMTQSFPSGDGSTPEIQAKLTTLTGLHQQATTELSTLKSEIVDLTRRLTDSTNQSQIVISESMKEKTNLERELRWAKQGREAAEKAEQRARKELDEYYKYQDSGNSMPGGLGSADQSGRIRQLESLVAQYKTELDSQSRDSRDLEEKIAQGQGLVKSTLLAESQNTITSLETQIQALEQTLQEVQVANSTLDAEVNDLMRRVASGEYNPTKERVLELQSNPASRIMAIRNQVLEDLKKENEVLIERLRATPSGGAGAAGGEDGGEGSGLIPKESWDRLCKEKKDMEKAHEKRLMRLKEIFTNKSKEFLEAVYSLLGWRIKFDESGQDIRLTSMYAPKGKMGLTLKFKSHEGHFGTMQMSGGMARNGELEECRRFWVVERQSIPGFLAQVTTEMFEKTTVSSRPVGRRLCPGQ